jgi:hypothetical protein
MKVTFTFRKEVRPNRRRDVLKAIQGWDSVQQAAALKPDAKAELTRRVGFAVLKEDADPDAVVQQISDLDEIETASVPEARRPI